MGSMMHTPLIPHQTIDSFMSDTRQRIESLEDELYGEHIFALRIWKFELRLRRVKRTGRPAPGMNRMESERKE